MKLRSMSRAIALGLLASAASGPVFASHVGETLTVDQQLLGSSDQLLDALAQWERLPPAGRAAREAQLVRLAQVRKDQLLRLLDKQPEVAAARMMPPALRARLPAAAAAHVEQQVALQGTVFAAVADDFARGVSHVVHKLSTTGGETLDVQLADGGASGQALNRWLGKKVSLRGMRIGQRLALLEAAGVQAAGADSSGGSVQAATPTVQGTQKTLAILLNFSDKAMSCTTADVANRLFGSTGATVNNNFRESSRGLVSFTGQAIGPFTINYSAAGSCDYSGWAAAADAAARAAGVDPSQYNRVSYVTPGNSNCGWAGLAYMPGRQSWVQSCAATGVYSHELGHNLALHHAATPTSEYGDGSDPMGGARVVGLNAANRVMAGWLPSGSVVDVSSAGTYTLATLSADNGGAAPQVLRLRKADTNEYYYVSLRQALNLDAALGSSYLNTLSVHRSSGTLPAKTYLLQSVAAGQSFTDTVNGITITHQGVNGNTAAVAVALGGGSCVRNTPQVSVAPASQSGLPGTSLRYTVTVSNTNSPSCGTSSFALTQGLPQGFTGSFGTTSLAVAAGSSASTSWTVGSGTSAATATYTLTAQASDTAGSASGAAHASYVVYADAIAPSVAITSPAPNAQLSGTVTISADARDDQGVVAVEFYIDNRLHARDTSAPYSVSWNTRKSAKGAHVVKVRAVDAAGNAAEQSLSVTVR